MKLILMKHTLAYIMKEVKDNNQSAINLVSKFNEMNVEDKGNYLLLTDKIIV